MRVKEKTIIQSIQSEVEDNFQRYHILGTDL